MEWSRPCRSRSASSPSPWKVCPTYTHTHTHAHTHACLYIYLYHPYILAIGRSSAALASLTRSWVSAIEGTYGMCARARGTNNAYSVRVRVCVRVCVCLRLYITAVHTRARTHARTHLMHARAHPPTLLAGITTAISVQERMARPADYSRMLNAVFGTLVVVCAKPIARAHPAPRSLRWLSVRRVLCAYSHAHRDPRRLAFDPAGFRVPHGAPTAGLSCRCSYLIFAIACYVRLARPPPPPRNPNAVLRLQLVRGRCLRGYSEYSPRATSIRHRRPPADSTLPRSCSATACGVRYWRRGVQCSFGHVTNDVITLNVDGALGAPCAPRACRGIPWQWMGWSVVVAYTLRSISRSRSLRQPRRRRRHRLPRVDGRVRPGANRREGCSEPAGGL